MVCRWDGMQLEKFWPQVPMGRPGDWWTALGPHFDAWGGRTEARAAIW